MDETTIIVLLAVVAAAAGFVDAVAGGGGLITVPALLLAQVPNLQALATNKLQASLGTLSASITMIAAGHVDLRRIWKDVAACFAGAVLGTALVRLARPDFLDIAIPVVVAATCVFFLLSRNVGRTPTAPRVSSTMWRRLGLPLLGFYDGYFGPGAGMFYQAGQVAMRGLTIVAATANAKPLNLASNSAALVLFIAGGDVVWSIGLAMMAGQAIGGYLGARAVISHGHRFIRAAIVGLCLLMLAKFGWDSTGSLRVHTPSASEPARVLGSGMPPRLNQRLVPVLQRPLRQARGTCSSTAFRLSTNSRLLPFDCDIAATAFRRQCRGHGYSQTTPSPSASRMKTYAG